MRFLFDNQLYQVRFRHFTIPDEQLEAEIEAERWPIITNVTSCQLALINKDEDGGELEPRQLVEGQAFCSLLDQFDRRRGRLISLGRALAELWPTDQARRKRFVRVVLQEEKKR